MKINISLPTSINSSLEPLAFGTPLATPAFQQINSPNSKYFRAQIPFQELKSENEQKSHLVFANNNSIILNVKIQFLTGIVNTFDLITYSSSFSTKKALLNFQQLNELIQTLGLLNVLVAISAVWGL